MQASVNKIDIFNLCKSANAKTQCHIVPLGYPNTRVNVINDQLMQTIQVHTALPLIATPKVYFYFFIF